MTIFHLFIAFALEMQKEIVSVGRLNAVHGCSIVIKKGGGMLFFTINLKVERVSHSEIAGKIDMVTK